MALLASCDQLVDPGAAESVDLLSPANEEALVGSTASVALKVRSADGEPIPRLRVAWRTVDPEGNGTDYALNTDEDGTVEAPWEVGTRAGEGTLTVEVDGLEPATFVIRIKPGPAVSVLQGPESLLFQGIGVTKVLEARPEDQFGNPVEEEVSWESSDPLVVVVSGSGEVTSVGPGQANVLVRAGAAESSVPVTVEAEDDGDHDEGDPEPASVEVEPASLTLQEIGAQGQLTAHALDAEGTPIPDPGTFTWTSDDEDVAVVDASGRVTAAGEGTATITAQIAGVSGHAQVTVELDEEGDDDEGDPEPASVEVEPASLTLQEIGAEGQLTAHALDAEGTPIPDPGTFTWTSDDEDVAVVDASGRVTAAGEGTATITAQIAGVKGHAQVTVELDEEGDDDEADEHQAVRDILDALREAVTQLQEAGVLSAVQANGLRTSLNQAESRLDSGNISGAIQRLETFRNQVQAHIGSGTLTEEQGQPLLDGAQEAIELLGG